MSNLLDIVLQQKYRFEVDFEKKPKTLLITEEDFKALINDVVTLQEDNVHQIETTFSGLKVQFQKEGTPEVK